MPAISSGPSTKYSQIEYPFGGLRTVPAPLGYGRDAQDAYGALGHYRAAERTGVLPNSLGADALVWAFRWTHASRLAVITRLRVEVAQFEIYNASTEFSLEAFIGRTYTAAHTGGTALTQTGNNFKVRTSHPTTSVGEIRIATTAALGGGTITLAAHPFAASVSNPIDLNAAAGTINPVGNLPRIDWSANVANGEHPIVLAQNEGIVINSAIAIPTTGTFVLGIECAWAEVESYMDAMGNPV